MACDAHAVLVQISPISVPAAVGLCALDEYKRAASPPCNDSYIENTYGAKLGKYRWTELLQRHV